MAGWSLTGIDPARTGNAHPVYAPHGIYPCKEENWVAIACKTDQQWQALAEFMQKPEWLDPSFSKAAVRQAHRKEIDRSIGAWTQTQDHLLLMAQLQRLGIAAGAVMTGPELLADPHLKARGSFLAQDRPQLGVKHYPNQPYRFRCAGPVPNLRAPLLGEHTEEVLADLVGLTPDELTDLEAADVIGNIPLTER